MIFIGYENNSYCFIHYIQENIIFHSTHAISNENLFPKYTDSFTKEYKLYDKLLNKINSETELLALGPSSKNKPALVSILHFQNNPSTHFLSPSLSYKSLSLLPTSGSKKSIVEMKEINNVNSDVEI